jgi:drug/metabolite transporter (DMT)-like permease
LASEIIDNAHCVIHDWDMVDQDSGFQDNTLQGIALVIGATLIFALSDAAAKLIVGRLPPIELFWIRSIVVANLTIAFVISRKGFVVLKSAYPMRQLGRGLCVFAASVLFLTGLSKLPLADNSAINFIWPIMVTVLSVIFLKEKIGIRRVLATLVGFTAMLIMVKPGSSAFQIAAIFPFAAALFWAMGTVMLRGMTNNEAPEITMVWSALIALVGSSLFVPFFWVTPSPYEIGIAAVVGFGSAIGHALVIFAYRTAPASTLSPYTYAQLIWAFLLGYLMFDAIPDQWVILGGIIIAASGIYTAHREHVRRQEAAFKR